MIKALQTILMIGVFVGGFAGVMLVLNASQSTILTNLALECERDIDYALEDRTRLHNPLLKSRIQRCMTRSTILSNPRISAKGHELLGSN
ncbi:hypothetical protein [Pseudoxanthomonas winnipegensis]|uniref:hypothetical protein n=1 Tax=Pseudoxanthomonas winnipegensis TaxID=2480810 RepID=UPI00103CA801|nr:hypothetical protein [Pseudoxanthomonas winnipegensis]TBV70624.1 hypothetical protein EYC45_18200 [Pseudoxanthomonas winnipegensis]